jgi:uncharacterized protein (TIGR00661 family)
LQKTILYAVLNWGLGHASRSIPIIRALILRGYKLVIVSDGEALTLLQGEFPEQQFEATKSYAVEYALKAKSFNTTLALQIPKFIQAIKEEHRNCQFLCKKYAIDKIISDNRYGFYHKEIPSAFICHQLHLRYPASTIIEKIVNKSYQYYLKNFTQLWVPDLAPPNSISGEMSGLNWFNVHYLGIDSRLEKLKVPEKYQYIAILSGPEPQRSLLEAELLLSLNSKPGEHVIIRGTNDARQYFSKAHVQVYDMMNSTTLNTLICSSQTVLCRAGYTSILDLLKLDKDAILIPTPGQAEQEYLADNLKKLRYFGVEKQGEIELLASNKQERPKLNFGYNFELIQSFLSC